ncbi:pentatricopeptide repeat-containing protein [Dorcoceras hygrometricum]|uniref:Pentatricopeptide repeat-containing protein n=1 Tax=Dorcoceras hygrometricum TaxID=472368 RepID=A0A2Z7B5Y8_9LAMI|nr:pentatricopeptide repeat-containing protein [Dorcoceras hygrometricum]
MSPSSLETQTPQQAPQWANETRSKNLFSITTFKALTVLITFSRSTLELAKKS